MSTILFVTATHIKDHTFVDSNVDEKYIRISIEQAQKIHIRGFIGSGLYDELVSQIDADTLTALNTTLLDDYVIPALEWWTLYEVAPFMTYKLTNKNIVKKNSDNSSGIDYNELDQFMNLITDKAQYFTSRLINYLMQNQSSYPLYFNPGTGIDTIFPTPNAFDCGIYLGNTVQYRTTQERLDHSINIPLNGAE